MRVTTEQLNEVAKLIGTNDKNAVISCVIKCLIDEGYTFAEAFDAVMGDEAYSKLVGILYGEMTAQ